MKSIIGSVVAMVVAINLIPANTIIVAAPAPQVMPIPSPVSTHVRELLLKIAKCESGNNQFDEQGNVIRGKQNRNDIGRFQINLTYHLEEAKALGFDLFTDEGNSAFAFWLYDHEGTQPWNWSKSCWDP